MKISIIVAAAANGAIGKGNKLLWHLPADMKFFRETTTGHCVITGRKNYESIPLPFRPLPQRKNIVLTRNTQMVFEGAKVVHSMEEALEYCRSTGETEAFIIGGAEIYREALRKGLVDRIYITDVLADFDADAFFHFQREDWNEVGSTFRKADEKNPHDMFFRIYDRK